jgi:oligosaccharide repeat unit polymerase
MTINKILLNPFFLYSFIWLGTLFLYSVEFTNNLKPMVENTYFLIFSTIVSFALIYLFSKFLAVSYPKKTILQTNNEEVIFRFKKLIKLFFNFWLIITLLEVILFKGIPIINVLVLGQYDLDYKKFGIPTLHGFLNSIYYTLIIGYSYLLLFKKEKKYRKILLLLFLWPVLVMSRAVLLVALIQFLLVYIISVKIRLRQLFIMLTFVFGFVYVFGLIGDSRGGGGLKRFTVETFVNDQYVEFAEKIPSGFVWTYLYMTTPLNNVNYTIDVLKPDYKLKYTFRALIPSIIRNSLFDGDDRPLSLDNEAFNMSTFFSNFLRDVGVYGAILIVAFLQFIITLFYFSLKKGRIGSIVSYGALYFALITSIFGDSFFTLAIISQILIGIYINNKIYLKKHV